MSDYISREAAIEELRKAADCANCDAGAGGLCGFCDIENAARLINGIPAADVEPVRNVRIREGEEQYVEDFGWFRWDYCLNCGSGFNITGHLRYCPYCGGKAVLESGPPIPLEHVEATDEEAEEFFHATKEAVAKFCGGCGAKMDLEADHES